jgi:hypothetical protein
VPGKQGRVQAAGATSARACGFFACTYNCPVQKFKLLQRECVMLHCNYRQATLPVPALMSPQPSWCPGPTCLHPSGTSFCPALSVLTPASPSWPRQVCLARGWQREPRSVWEVTCNCAVHSVQLCNGALPASIRDKKGQVGRMCGLMDRCNLKVCSSVAA